MTASTTSETRPNSRPLQLGSLCTGYGGLDLAVHSLWKTELAWCADNDRHASKIAQTRFPGAPNLGDLTAIDWRNVPQVDLITAGWPCQDISFAGRGAGMRKDTRSGLWFTIARAIRILRPDFAFLENVAALRTRGLSAVLGELAACGYDTAWVCLRASDIGAPHKRERMFLLAAANPNRIGIDRDGKPWPQRRKELARNGRIVADPRGVQCQRLGTRTILAGPPGPPPRTADAAAECRRATAADATGERHRNHRASGRQGIRAAAVGGAAADAPRLRCHQGQPEPARQPRRPDPALGGGTDWGPYEPAIRRWEKVLDSPAPHPTEPGRRGQPRIAAEFVQWCMGLAGPHLDGWVTDIDIPRTAQMRALGNGVVPQQAAAALELLIGILRTNGEAAR
jgi:DNA (cytosine-5)-methyltransferase 1